MSTKVIASLAIILATVLPIIGIDVGSEQLTEAIQVIVTVVSGVYIWIRTVKKEELTPLGMRR